MERQIWQDFYSLLQALQTVGTFNNANMYAPKFFVSLAHIRTQSKYTSSA
jgi:hypothetical protein